jgi:23S rRNA pseudouridine1911/1915/1917 synthase
MTLNLGYAHRERVPTGGERVLDFLVRTRRHSDQEAWLARIVGGEVEVDGLRADPETRLRAGQLLQWNRPPWDEPEVAAEVEWIFVDEVILAVGKPRGLSTLPAGGFLQQTLLARVREAYPEANPMHRLGRETSGLVLFTRTHAAAASVQAAWREHAVRKFYRALGSGVPSADTLDIQTPIGPVAHPLLGTVHAASPSGKASRSLARVLERREANTLFEVEILTGRPHQIRIHLASVGHPLVGDPLYGPGGIPETGCRGLPGDGGYFLHAERLEFPHPLTGERMRLRAAPPAELRMAKERAPNSPGDERREG